MYGPGDSFLAIVLGKPFATRGHLSDKLQYRFDPDTDAISAPAFGGDINGIPVLKFRVSLKPAHEAEALSHQSEEEREQRDAKPIEPDVDRETGIRGLTLSGAFKTPITLETGSMGVVMDQARACMDELISARGFDAKAYHVLSRRAVPIDAQRWITNSDYPYAMLRASRSDVVYFRVTVGADGKPEACETLSEDSSTAFGQVICGVVMQRGNFLPALGADGKSTMSFWQGEVAFIVAEQ
jgi:hypothetical protein